MNDRLAAAIVKEAQRIGADPVDFGTVISFETGGTFDPWVKGPTTKWGVHRGLIQMGEPQREQFGYYEGMPIEDAVKASADYLVANGFRPGMTGAQLYATINTGSPDGGHKSDTAAGGTWGSSDDKWNHQMDGHRVKAEGLLNGTYIPEYNNPYEGETGQGPQIDPLVHVGVNAATGPDMFQVQEQAEAAPKPYESFFAEMGAEMASTGITSHALRWMTEDQIDLDYRIPEAQGQELLNTYPEQYHDMILGAGSESNLQSRLKWISEDMDSRDRLDAGGGSAIAAGVVGSILDPVSFAVGAATGGIGIVAKGGLAVKAAAGAAVGAATGAGLDAVSKEVFDDPYADPLLAGIVGAGFGALGGALARNKATVLEADLAATAGALTTKGKLRDGASEAIIAQSLDSAGAARNTSFRDPLISAENAYVSEVADESVPYGFGKGFRFDTTGQMTTSKNPLVRLLGANLFEEAAGFADNSVVPDSVNSQFTAYHRRLIGNFVTEYQPAKADYIKSMGVGRLNLVARSTAEAEYNRAVAAFVRDPMPLANVDPNVVKGAAAVRNLMNTVRKSANEAGLADLDENPNYLPLVANHTRIAELDQTVSKEAMEEFISQAILKHTADLDANIVQRMAKGYWNTIRKAGYGIEDGLTRAVQLGDKDGFKRSFLEAVENRGLLTDDQIDAAYDALTGVMDAAKRPEGESARGVGFLRKRTLMDYGHKATIRGRNGETIDLSIYDLFEDDAEFLSRRYARTMSGRVAFANMKVLNPSKGEVLVSGIRSEADLDKVKDMVKESYRLMDGDYNTNRADLENQLQNIDFAWKRINGIPVWDNQNAFNQWARRIKDMQFIRLMSNMGLNQAQEGWKIMALTGFRASLSQMPSIRTMAAGVHAGKFPKDKLLTELTDITGIGLDGLWNKFDMRLEEDRVGQLAGSSFSRKVDSALEAGTQLTGQISLMRSIHDYQQRWAMKAITQQLVHMGHKMGSGMDLSKIKPRDRARLASLGLGDDDAKLLIGNLMKHSEFDGKKIVGVNVTQWDAEAVSKFRTYLGRYTDRLVQANDFGGLAKWMSQPVASMFIQFRSFVFGAWAKSTLWTLNHGGLKDPRMIVLLLGELAAGTATYMVRQAGNYATEEGRQKMEEELTPANLLKNGWARTATASVIPMLMDSALMFTPAGPQFGNARSSGSPTDALFGSPVIGQIQSAATFSKGLMQSEEMTQNEVKSGLRALPLPTNWIPFTAALGALVKDRE